VRGVYGDRGHAAAGAERFPHAVAGSRSPRVESGSRTLKDAINERCATGSQMFGPHIICWAACWGASVSDDGEGFSSRDWREARAQILKAEGKTSGAVIACVGGDRRDRNLYEFIKDKKVRLIGVEAGRSRRSTGRTCGAVPRRIARSFAGNFSYVLQDAAGQIANTHSISAGLDYPSIARNMRR